ncbi:MAG: hypothetical protein ACRCSB_04515 [Bacteroidales bacterium]
MVILYLVGMQIDEWNFAILCNQNAPKTSNNLQHMNIFYTSDTIREEGFISYASKSTLEYSSRQISSKSSIIKYTDKGDKLYFRVDNRYAHPFIIAAAKKHLGINGYRYN